jgi:hypothetical protein
VHRVEYPRSYHIRRTSSRPVVTLRARSYACTVSYVMEVGAGAAFKCEMVGKACTIDTQRANIGVAWMEPILLYRSIESAVSPL